MFTPPKVVSEICMDGEDMMDITDFPDDAIIISGQYDTSVDFTINQAWDDVAGIAIKSDNIDLDSSCDVYGDVTIGASFDFQSKCVHGITGVTVVVYYDSNFNPEQCVACDVEELSDMGGKFCAYYIEIPCEPMSVECGAPSAAPSGSFYPSSFPSDSPTISSYPSSAPSSSPSASPSDSPSTSPSVPPSGSPSASPSHVPSGAPSAAPSGSPSGSPSDGPTVMPSSSPSGSPSTNPSGAPSLAPSSTPSITPSGSPSTTPSSDPSVSPSSPPSSSPSASPSDAPSGSPSEAPSGSFYPSSQPSGSPSQSAYPSTTPSSSPSKSPSASPSAFPSSEPSSQPSSVPTTAPTRCPRTQPVLIDTIGSTPFPEGAPPIQITFQNTTHVRFKVINTWETTFTNVYTQYHEGNFGETECLEEENVLSFTEVDEYTATCMHHVPISIVNVWVVDANKEFFSVIDDAEVPECCHPPVFSQVPTVQYTFKLDCVDPCPPEDEVATRRLSSHTENDSQKIEPPKQIKAFSSVSTADKPSADGKDGHFCVSEDYPCGDDGSRVNVCHYSARDGYKTFCVPEADSDVLAFYKKDYCGPCVRGFGEKTTRK